MARPKGVKAPEKEKVLTAIDSIYSEMQVLRERAAKFENIIDEKNKEIKEMKRQLVAGYQGDLHEFLTLEMAYGKLMREMRLEAGLTLQRMCVKINVSFSQLHKMEHGDPMTNTDTIISSYERMREMKQRGELNK